MGLFRHEFQLNGASYLLCRASEAARLGRPSLATGVAESVLRQLLSVDGLRVRNAYADLSGAGSLYRIPDHELLRRLLIELGATSSAARFGHLALLEIGKPSLPQWQSPGSGARARSRESVPREPAQTPSQLTAPRVVETDWIEIRLIDDRGNPVADQAYQLKLSDGSARKGKLDAKGRAHVSGVAAGACEVTFPGFAPSVTG